ncbi:MAG: uroporphyrinogen decarboxylase family protein [Lentisphaeria bacterium]
MMQKKQRNKKCLPTMTSLQRLVTASMGEEPDRVPVTGPFTLDWAWGQLYGANSFADIGRDAEKLAKCMIWYSRDVGIDGIMALYSIYGVTHSITKQSGLTYSPLKWDNFVPTDPHSLYEGDFLEETAYGDPVIKTKEDALKLKPADPYKDPDTTVLLKAIKIATKELGDECLIAGSSDDILSIISALMGWTQAFKAIIFKDPKYYETFTIVRDVVAQTMRTFCVEYLKAGAQAICGHTELPHKEGAAAFLANPDCVHLELDLPCKLVEECSKVKQFSYLLHICSVGPYDNGIGAWKELVKRLGPMVGFAIAEYGGAKTLVQFKKELAPASISGNIHPINTMLLGTPADVEAACVEAIRVAAPGGRFMLGPGCMLPLEVPYENVRAMVKTAETYGKYPIKL